MYLRYADTKKLDTVDLQFKLTGSPVILFGKSLSSAGQNSWRTGSLGRAPAPQSYCPQGLTIWTWKCVSSLHLHHHLKQPPPALGEAIFPGRKLTESKLTGSLWGAVKRTHRRRQETTVVCWVGGQTSGALNTERWANEEVNSHPHEEA